VSAQAWAPPPPSPAIGRTPTRLWPGSSGGPLPWRRRLGEFVFLESSGGAIHPLRQWLSSLNLVVDRPTPANPFLFSSRPPPATPFLFSARPPTASTLVQPLLPLLTTAFPKATVQPTQGLSYKWLWGVVVSKQHTWGLRLYVWSPVTVGFLRRLKTIFCLVVVTHFISMEFWDP
jgi:hypothetical protein